MSIAPNWKIVLQRGDIPDWAVPPTHQTHVRLNQTLISRLDGQVASKRDATNLPFVPVMIRDPLTVNLQVSGIQ
jgi:hypothetical protein